MSIEFLQDEAGNLRKENQQLKAQVQELQVALLKWKEVKEEVRKVTRQYQDLKSLYDKLLEKSKFLEKNCIELVSIIKSSGPQKKESN